MSARKRHTSALDFMRLMILSERAGGYVFEEPWRHREEMVQRLLKRGWLRYERSSATSVGSWRPIFQRRNILRTTAKGRRAVYVADRHATPSVRLHDLGGSYWRSIRGPIEGDQRSRRRLAEASSKLKGLYG